VCHNKKGYTDLKNLKVNLWESWDIMKVWQRFSFKIFTFMFAIALSVVLTSSLIFYYLAEQKLVTGLAGKAKELSLEAAAELQSDIVLYQDLLSGKISQKNAESLIENQLRLMQLSLGPQGVENIYTLEPLANSTTIK